MAVIIQTSDGSQINSMKDWRTHVYESDPDGLSRFFEGLDEVACAWCAGGSHGVPEEVVSLLATRWSHVAITKVVASPQVPTGVRGATFWADLVLSVTTSEGEVVVIVLAGKRAFGSDKPLAKIEASVADDLTTTVFDRRFLKRSRPAPELALLPSRLVLASAAAFHTAKQTSAAAAAVIVHEIMTPTTFQSDVRLGRSLLKAFARTLGIEDLQPGMLVDAARKRTSPAEPSLSIGLCVRDMPGVPWIV